MSDPGKLAETLNKKLGSLHDPVVSEDPFSWSDSDKDRQAREKTFRDVSEKLNTFIYVSKTGTVVKILLFGTALPLLVLAILYLAGIPAEEDMRLWVWGGLVATAVISAIATVVIADDPDIDSDLALAAYAVPRGWSFSRIKTGKVWQKYQKHFRYFNQGDEDQEIECRIWGYSDAERKRPFQLFHFYFEEVYYTTEFIRDAKGNVIGTRQVKHEIPHHRYGIFSALPESKVRFRISETNGDAGLDTHIALEYGALNKEVDIYCDAKDELTVRQFLSPAVQEVVMEMSNDLSEMHIDFYPGLVLIVTDHDFLDRVVGIELDENTSHFEKAVKPAEDLIEGFRGTLLGSIDKIKKYNDNYPSKRKEVK